MSKKSEKSQQKNVKWGNNTSGEASGVYHGIQDTGEGRKAQKLENSAQIHYGNTGDERFLRHMGDAPPGQLSYYSMQNDPLKRWGGSKKSKSKTKSKSKSKSKSHMKKTKRHKK